MLAIQCHYKIRTDIGARFGEFREPKRTVHRLNVRRKWKRIRAVVIGQLQIQSCPRGEPQLRPAVSAIKWLKLQLSPYRFTSRRIALSESRKPFNRDKRARSSLAALQTNVW